MAFLPRPLPTVYTFHVTSSVTSECTTVGRRIWYRVSRQGLPAWCRLEEAMTLLRPIAGALILFAGLFNVFVAILNILLLMNRWR